MTLLVVALLGCSGAWRDVEDPALTDPELRRARIEELKTAIAQDRTTLEDLITRPDVPDAVDLHKDPQVRTIAVRLTENEHMLQRLEAATAEAEAAK